MNQRDIGVTDGLARVRRLSVWLSRLTSFGMVTFCLFALSMVVLPDWFDSLVELAYPQATVASGITVSKRTVLLLVLSLPLCVTLYGLWNLRLLFDAYARGEVFAPAPAIHIRNVGMSMLVNVVLSVLVHSIGSVVLTIDNPAGSRQLTISISSDTYLLLLMGGLLVVIGWVMREAARISEENSRFV